ncbi:MAG: winged helix-turn-helix transcriptional regulator [Dokdonella sp.]|uniref:MarR family winged helix-turn-helix transcriptional regulator n=1 Tax=Dokdonella sp. TaxID=2291710 RepID=UPI0025C5770C|nr:MarR family winged helix-turn-helix transcriptional regulator [Dokdonella sp.]MBX3702018.1 winged helix-turn-helix transcriptional regulator [Dokdonella sp.]
MIQTQDNTFAYLLHDVTRLLRKHFDRRATHLQLTRAQWRALKVIEHRPGLSQAELADHLDMEPIPVGRVIDRLQKAGYVERRADPADRRRWCLHLTGKADGVIAQMEVIGAGLREDALRHVDGDDFKAMLRALAQLKGNLVALDQNIGADSNQRRAS